MKEQLRFHRLKRTKSFRGLFHFNNLDLSYILFDEWSKSYWGDQQYAKLQGLVTTNYFEELNQNQIVITYGELHMQNRATYFLTKSIKPLIKFISIQHATSFKNKMFTYYRKSEFNFEIENDGIKYMPRPDFYLVQGDQYKKVLSEFFDETLISVIGSLKNILPENFQKFDKKNNSSLNQFNKNKKYILIAPSITDYKVLIEAFKSWKYDANYSIILSPHPASDIEKISQYIIKIMPNQKINLVTNLRTYELLPLCDLVVTGYSTIAIEAAAFKVPSVRFTVPGEMSQFEYDNRIPSFKEPDEFLKWLKGFQLGKYKLKNIDYEKIISDYFYKNDGNAQQRLWEFLKNNF